LHKIILLNPVKKKIKVRLVLKTKFIHRTVNALRLGYEKLTFNYVFEKNLCLC